MIPPTLSAQILHVSILASQVLCVLVFLLAAFLLIQKAVSERWSIYRMIRAKSLKERMVSCLDNEDVRARMILETLGYFDRPILRSLLLERAEEGGSPIVLKRVEDLYDTCGAAGEDIRLLRRSWFWWMRAAAAHHLGQIRLRRAKPHLLQALQDPHTEVRLEATWALGRMGFADTLPIIVKSLAHYFKIAALRMDNFIFEMGHRALPFLLGLCRGGAADPEVQLLAIHLVGEFQDPMSLNVLRELLKSPNVEIRIAACKALGTLGLSEGMYEIMPCLSDEAWQVRAQAAKQLGKNRCLTAAGPLIKSLEDRVWWVRFNAGEALSLMEKTGEAALRVALKSSDRFARDMAQQWLVEMESMA